MMQSQSLFLTKNTKEDLSMFTIRLFCAAGMSTSLLVNKMKEVAKEMGLEADISATAEA